MTVKKTRSGYPLDHSSVVRALKIIDMLNDTERPLTVKEWRRLVTGLDADYRFTLEEIHRLFGDWEAYIEAASMRSEGAEPVGARISDDRLLGALQFVAKELGVKSLSSGSYDKYRDEHIELGLPSSSVIRKWMDKWEIALEKAGLESVQPGANTVIQRAEALRFLRRAAQSHGSDLTPRLYKQYAAEYGNGKLWPSTDEMLRLFGSWEEAMRQADIEILDDLQPDTLWTIAEARRALKAAQVILGGKINREQYEWVKEQAATRPMPSWDEVCMLLHISLGTDVTTAS